MRGHTFTPERMEQIRNLVARGRSREEIAEIIGCTISTLKTMCSRLGVSLRRPRNGTGSKPMPLPPLPVEPTLTSEEADVVHPIAWSLPPDRAAEFLHAVEHALASHPVRGPGLAHRVAVALLPAYFVPPSSQSHRPRNHVNIRIARNPALYRR
jgi:hypothetical protein